MLVVVFVAAMLASPQTRAAVMRGDGDVDPRVLAADDEDPSRVAVVADLPPLAFAIAGHPRATLASTFAYADRATGVEREGPRARGPP